MKPAILAIVALVLYAVQNVVMEQKLSKYNTCAILIYAYLAMMPLAIMGLMYLKATGQEIAFPSGQALLITLAAGTTWFFADYCYIGAYTAGGSVFTITSIVVMFPAFAAATRLIWLGNGWPNRYQTIGYCLAVVAVLLVTKGSTKEKAVTEKTAVIATAS